ncbi:hypothetical protein D3C80_2123170 [compost metagenome]
MPIAVLVHIQALMGEFGAGHGRGNTNRVAVAGCTLDPFVTATGNVAPTFKACLETALGFTKFHQIVGGAKT